MVKSMTGYGRAGDGAVTIEIKSVNHRYLDISVRTPRLYAFLEEPVKSLVRKSISHGKVEVQITIDFSKQENTDISLNFTALEGYLSVGSAIAEQYGLKNDLTVSGVLRLPEVINTGRSDISVSEVTSHICAMTGQALEEFDSMRSNEGQSLANDILLKCDEIERITALAEARSPVTLANYRARLEAKLTEVLENTQLDPARILTEAAIFADKISVDEETVRLRSHISQMRSMMASGGVLGRKLDFLVQEFGREANTIGSKGNDLEMSKIVVDLKTEIEKIREQVQNIE